MKNLLIAIVLFLYAPFLFAQSISTTVSQLPVVGISTSVTLHFISPEKISYVDLSSHALIGDLPGKNILRVRLVPDSISKINNNQDAGILTIVGERFIAQYRLCFVENSQTELISTQIEITPTVMKPIDISGIGISENEMKLHALSMLSHRGPYVRRVSDFGISLSVNKISTVGDYLFLDLSFNNKTHLDFLVDELRFKIEDKKINKVTNLQGIEIKPIFQLYDFDKFKRSFRNIYVLPRATFPGDRLLNIELSEKQLSARNLRLSLRYSDILEADTLQ